MGFGVSSKQVETFVVQLDDVSNLQCAHLLEHGSAIDCQSVKDNGYYLYGFGGCELVIFV